MTMKMFSANSEPLGGLMIKIKNCEIQLPDFQRGWVWDDERIRKLLVSIAKSFPIGAIMLLESGSGNACFFPRPIEGVDNFNKIMPDLLLLDGQQRLTSLYQTLMLKKPILTKDSKNNPVEREYYIKIADICNQDYEIDDMIISVPGDKKVKGLGVNNIIYDYSTTNKEYENEVFPISLFFDDDEANKWMYGFEDAAGNDGNMLRLRRQKTRKLSDLINDFKNYQVPTITLDKSNSKEAVCSVFENVNTGGVSLTVFELLTASFAADNFRLRQNWEAREIMLKKPYEINQSNILNKAQELVINRDLVIQAQNYAKNNLHEVLKDISSVDFLQSLCLLVSYHNGKAVSCKRKDILQLEVHDYISWADKLTMGFFEAAIFLQEQYVFSTRDIPYGSQLVPLAALFTELNGEMHQLNNKKKMSRWYWCGALGELYGGANETRYARDFADMIEWIRNNSRQEPLTIFDANFAQDRLMTLRTRNSAAYKAINVLLVKNGAKDFESGSNIDLYNFYGMGIDIHHIFPKAYCEKVRIDMARADTIINKAPLSYKTNRSIGGRRPSEYINTFDKRLTVSQVDNLLISQCIEPAFIRTDNFDKYFDDRKLKILNLIESAMGKKAI